MKTKKQLLELIEGQKNRGAWSKGVNLYAYELIESTEVSEDFQFTGSKSDIEMLLNGAKDWKQYSEGGCALIYSGDIAERLCTPSELKKTNNGQKDPNKNENWIDCQARALSQARNLISNLIRA